MKKISLPFVVSLILLVLFSGCSKNNTLNTSLDNETKLAIGQTAKISSEDLSIRLTDVTNDSRCAQGVTCIWAGEVKCQLSITLGTTTESYTFIVSGAGDKTGQVYQGYKLVANVTPYPKQGVTISPDDYRMILTVGKVP